MPDIGHRKWAVALALATVLALPAGTAAQESDPLAEALRAHRTTLELTPEGRLTGPGADLLISEGERSQFLLVGEEHGIAEVPELTAALFRALQPAGYRHLAVEIGPTIADTLEGLARDPEDPLRAFIDFFSAHPPGTAFFTAREDAELLIDAVRTTDGAEGTIWGLDYDILADRYALRRLRDLAPTDAARAAVDAAIERADAGLAAALEASNPAAVAMFAGPDTAFDALVPMFGPEPIPEAARILHTLTETVRINGHFVAGEGWESNERRARLNKRHLAEHYREAAERETAPRAVFRFGSNHMMRGRTSTNVYDVGQMVASIADLNGLGSFHLLVVGGPGTRRLQFDPRTFGWMEVPVSIVETPWAEPLHALLEERWTLFDLRPLRPLADRDALGDLPAAAERMIYGFDAVLVLVGSRPGESLPGAPWLNGARSR